MAYYYLAGLTDSRLIKKAVENIDHVSNKESYYIRSRAASVRGDKENHKKLLLELLDRYPNEKGALLELGLDAYDAAQYEKAIGYLTAILKIDPLHEEANTMLSYSYDAIGNVDKAAEAINNYIRFSPNEPNPYDSRGDLFARNGKIEEAIESYKIALEKKSDFHVSRENLGHMYVFQNKYEEAALLYRDLVNENKDQSHLTWYNLDLALIPVRLGKFDEALEIIDEVIVLYQNKAKEINTFEPTTTHFLKFWIYLEKNQINEAVKEAELCVSLSDLAHPDNLIYYRWTLAYSLALTGQHQRADSIIDAVDEYYHKNPSKPIAYYWARGMVALARHDGETAVSMMEKGVEGYTADTKFMGLARLGQVYLEAGMYEEAIRTLEPTTRVLGYQRLIDGVYGVKVHYFLGLAYEGIGDYTLATEQYTTFLELWKDADPGLLSVIDARERLTRLESAP
jgi:tetratricopeptide (TPR) repeat protein